MVLNLLWNYEWFFSADCDAKRVSCKTNVCYLMECSAVSRSGECNLNRRWRSRGYWRNVCACWHRSICPWNSPSVDWGRRQWAAVRQHGCLPVHHQLSRPPRWMSFLTVVITVHCRWCCCCCHRRHRRHWDPVLSSSSWRSRLVVVVVEIPSCRRRRGDPVLLSSSLRSCLVFLSVRLFIFHLKCVFVGHWPSWPISAGGHVACNAYCCWWRRLIASAAQATLT